MTMKSGKGKKPGDNHTPSSGNEEKKASPKSKKQEELDDDDDELVDGEEVEVKASKKGGKTAGAKKASDDDDEEDGVDEPDDWEKPEEEEEWDPDFDEFDIPASKGKKSGVVGKKGKEEEDDFKVDDEFKEMGLYNDSYEDDEEDDY